MHEPIDELRIPVIREELDVDKAVVETGLLRVRTQTQERQEAVELPLNREEFSVERVPVGRPVDSPAAVRVEGDVTIVPVHAEELVVSRRLVLKEELHIRRRVHEHVETRHVTVREQTVTVTREAPPPTQ